MNENGKIKTIWQQMRSASPIKTYQYSCGTVLNFKLIWDLDHENTACLCRAHIHVHAYR